MSKINSLIKDLKIKGRPGRLPKITPCPFCGTHLNQTQHAGHRTACSKQFRDAPPQPASLNQDPGDDYNKDGTLPQG